MIWRPRSVAFQETLGLVQWTVRAGARERLDRETLRVGYIFDWFFCIGKPLLRQNRTINSLPSSLLLAKLRMDVVNKEPHMNRAPLSYTPIEEIEKVTRELVA